MKWYIFYALKQLFPSGKRFSFFSMMSILGVAIGVMVLFVVRSVMDGFQEKIKQTIVETQGDVRVDSPHIIYDGNQLDKFLKNRPGVAATARYADGVVMLKHDNRPAFPIIKGIDLENEMKIIPFKKFIVKGDLSNFNSESIILSSELARQLMASIGSTVEIYSPKSLEIIDSSEVILPQSLEVVAIYESGYHQADQNVVIVPLETMQELYGLDEGIHGIAIKLLPKISPEKFAFQLNHLLEKPVTAASWQEMNKDFLFALKTERTLMGFVLIFIMIIAAFSITSSLTISVIRKTREIGLIGALGGSVKQCAACFLVQGSIIGSLGGCLGVWVGLLILKFRDNIIASFVKICGVEDFMLKFYSFAHMPAQYSVGSALEVIGFAVAICCLAGVWPALKAAKINPAEALRNE